MSKRFLLLILVLFSLHIVQAQIFWADQVLSYSSQRDEKAYSSKQVLGPPSKLPALGDCGCAWVPKLPDNNVEEFVRVSFEKKLQVSRIFVSENHNAGVISKIYLYDQYNRAHLVYEQSEADATYGRLKVIDIPQTSFLTNDLKLVLNTERISGYNQIDAIGVSDQKIDFVMPEVPKSDYFNYLSPAQNLGPSVNFPGSDIAPILSDNGKRLYFTRKDHPGNTGDRLNDDVWYADINGANINAAVNPGAPINNRFNNYVIGVANNGKILSLANQYNPEGNTSLGVAQTWEYGNEWRYPINLITPGLITYDFYVEYYINPERTVMLVSLEKASGNGLKDLYVCFSNNQYRWSKPKNMGSVVNTSGNEMAPSLSPDGKYLFFSSDGHPGYGEQDIYISKRMDDSWTNWSTPLNLGSEVNTDGFDAYFTYNDSSNFAYFTSTRESYFNPDIYRIQISPVEEEEELVDEIIQEDIKESTATIPDEEPLFATLPDGTILTDDLLLFGTIFDASTGKPVDAKVIFEFTKFDNDIDSLETLNKNYRKKITENVEYTVVVLKEGYLYYEEQLEITEVNKQKVKRKDFRIIPALKGEKFRLDNLYFRVNSYVIKSESWPELDQLAGFMNKNPVISIEIGGHTNGLCDEEFCNKLSKQRADAVKEYLENKGIDSSRIQTKGYGKTVPIASNETPEGRSANQRVEVTIL